MEFDNSFEVPLPPAEAWKVLLDIKRVAPCMPGAELSEVIDANTYKGKINVRLGPVALTFAGLVKFEHVDAASYTARVTAQGTDAKGRGGANAASVFRLEPAASGSKVLVHTDLALSGAVAQFAACLKDKLAQQHAAAPAAAPIAPPSTRPSPPSTSSPAQAAKPISGVALIAKVIWNWFAGLFRHS